MVKDVARVHRYDRSCVCTVTIMVLVTNDTLGGSAGQLTSKNKVASGPLKPNRKKLGP